MPSDIVTARSMAENLKDKVTEKIRGAFVELVTDEQWSQMTASALQSFTTERKETEYGKTKSVASEFDSMIHDILKEILRDRIATELRKPEYMSGVGSPAWGSFGPTPGDAVKHIMEALAPAMIRALFGSVVQESVRAVKNNLQRGY